MPFAFFFLARLCVHKGKENANLNSMLASLLLYVLCIQAVQKVNVNVYVIHLRNLAALVHQVGCSDIFTSLGGFFYNCPLFLCMLLT